MDEDQLSDADLWELKVSQGMPKDEATAYVRGRPKPSAAGDFARSAAQSATFGFSDELAGLIAAAIPGGKTGKEATAAARGNLDRAKAEHPKAALAGSIAGALPMMALPVGAGAQGVRAGAGLLGTLGRGAAVGAAEGGLLGLGEGEGAMGRMESAVSNAAFGAPLGAAGGLAAGLANAVRRGGAGRGSRVARELEGATGIRPDVNEAASLSDEAIEAVRREHYGALEDAFPVVDDPDLLKVLRSPSIRGQTRVIAPDVVADRPPSFAEAQKILLRLRRMNKADRRFDEQIAELDKALENAVPGYADADRAFAQAVGQRQALIEGRKMWNAGSADIQRKVKDLSPEAATQFRTGQIHEVVRRLEQRDESAGAALKRMLDAGPEYRAVMRSWFPDDEAFTAFERTLKKERSAEATSAELKRWALPIAIGYGANEMIR